MSEDRLIVSGFVLRMVRILQVTYFLRLCINGVSGQTVQFPFFFGGPSGSTKLVDIDVDTNDNIVMCGHSNSEELVWSTTQVPIMVVLDTTTGIKWSKMYSTNPSSTSFQVCTFRKDTNTRIFGVTKDKQTLLQIDGTDGSLLKSWKIDGQEDAVSFFGSFYDSNDNILLPGKGASGEVVAGGFNINSGSQIFTLSFGVGGGRDVVVDGGKYYMLTFRSNQMGWFTGAWPAGTYQYMMETTSHTASSYFEPYGLHLNNNVLVFNSRRQDSQKFMVTIVENPDGASPTITNTQIWGSHEAEFYDLWVESKTDVRVLISIKNTIEKSRFSFYGQLDAFDGANGKLTYTRIKESSGQLLQKSSFAGADKWVALGQSDNNHCSHSFYDIDDCKSTTSSDFEYHFYDDCDTGCSKEVPVMGLNDVTGCLAVDTAFCKCDISLYQKSNYDGAKEDFSLPNFAIYPLDGWIEDDAESFKASCSKQKILDSSMLFISNSIKESCRPSTFQEVDNVNLEKIVGYSITKYVQPSLPAGVTLNTVARTLSSITVTDQVIINHFPQICPNKIVHDAPVLSSNTPHYLIGSSTKAFTVAGKDDKGGFVQTHFVWKYILPDDSLSLDFPAVFKDLKIIEPEHTKFSFQIDSSTKSDAGKTYKFKLYAMGANLAAAATYEVQAFLHYLDQPTQEDIVYVVETVEQSYTLTYDYISYIGYVPSLSLLQNGGSVSTQGVTSTVNDNQITVKIQTDKAVSHGTHSFSIKSSLGQFIKEDTAFKVYIFSIEVPYEYSIPDISYTVKDPKLSVPINEPSIVYEPSIAPADATWSYEIKFKSDRSTPVPAFIKLITASPDPGTIAKLEIQTDSNVEYFSKPAPHPHEENGVLNLVLIASYSYSSFKFERDIKLNVRFKIEPPADTSLSTIFYIIGQPAITIPYSTFDYSVGVPSGNNDIVKLKLQNQEFSADGPFDGITQTVLNNQLQLEIYSEENFDRAKHDVKVKAEVVNQTNEDVQFTIYLLSETIILPEIEEQTYKIGDAKVEVDIEAAKYEFEPIPDEPFNIVWQYELTYSDQTTPPKDFMKLILTGTTPVAAKLEIHSTSNDDYFQVSPQTENGVHNMKLKISNDQGFAYSVDFRVNVVPLITVPSGPYNEEIYYVIGATNNPANQVSRLFGPFSPSATGKSCSFQFRDSNTDQTVSGISGSLATDGQLTVSLDITDNALFGIYDMKIRAYVDFPDRAEYRDESVTFKLYLIKVEITQPTVQDPIIYQIRSPLMKEDIGPFATTISPIPGDLPNYDTSGWTWTYKLLRNDQAVLDPGYLASFAVVNPATASKIGEISIQTDNNDEFSVGSDSHGNMAQNGKHPLLLQATISIGFATTVNVNLQLLPFLTEPSSPATVYHIIGLSSSQTINLDYSPNLQPSDTVTFELIEVNSKPIPTGITEDTSVDHQISITIDESDVANKGKFDFKVKATLNSISIENVVFTVYLMEVTVEAPSSPVSVNYKVGDSEHSENIPKFSLVSNPNPAGYWDDPLWTYQFLHHDQTSQVDSNTFFIKWDDTSPVAPNIGAVKIHTTNNDHYYADLSSNTGQVTDGLHTMYLKATSGKALQSATLTVTINMKPKIIPPTIADANIYFIIGTSTEIVVPLDYSTGIPSGKTLTLAALQSDDSSLPTGVTKVAPVSNQISLKILTTSEADFGEFDIKIKATLGNSPHDTVDETVVLKVFLMKVAFTPPTVAPISYKVKDAEKPTDIDLFVFTSTPTAPAFWGAHSISYTMTLSDSGRTAFPGSFFAAWEEDGTTKSGTLKLQTDDNDQYFKDHSADPHMLEDSKHVFKLKALSEKGPSHEIDISVTVAPFISVPAGPYNEEFYYVIGATNNPANQISRTFGPFTPSATGKSVTMELLDSSNDSEITGLTGSLATDGQYTVSINTADTNLAGTYTIKIKATLGDYFDETFTFKLYLIKVEITQPSVDDPIVYNIKDPSLTKDIAPFTTVVTPAVLPNYDISVWAWTYEFLRDDQAALNPGYIVTFTEENPAKPTKIAQLSIQTDANGEHSIGTDSHGNMAQNGIHPLLLKATYSIGFISSLPINLKLLPFITEPSIPSTVYHVIGTSSTSPITLDYSVGLPSGVVLTFELLEDASKVIPAGINLDTSTNNQVTLSFVEADTSKKGKYDIRIKATFGQKEVQGVHFTVYLMEVILQHPSSAISIDYLVSDPEHVEQIQKFTLVSDPNPTGYWDDPQWSYKFLHPDQTSEVNSATFFIKWDDSSPTPPNIGVIKVQTASNNDYYADLSSNTGQTVDGKHVMYLKATSAKATKDISLTFTVNMKPKMTVPSADPKHYFIIGTSSEISFTLDYGVGVPSGKTLTLQDSQTNNSPTPNGITADKSVNNQISFKINSAQEADFGEFDIKVKATFGVSPHYTVDETVVFKVYLIKVIFTPPTLTPISYTVKNPEKITDIGIVTFSSQPPVTDFWGASHSFTFSMLLNDQSAFPSSFFATWQEDGTTKSGTLKIQTDDNNELLISKSADTQMTVDAQHTFKLKVESSKGPIALFDIVINMTPFIVPPTSIQDMVFLVGGTQTTLKTQDFLYEGIAFALTLSNPSIVGVVTQETSTTTHTQMTVTLQDDPSLVAGKYPVTIDAKIGAYTNSVVAFNIFLVKVAFSMPSLTTIEYKAKDLEKVILIGEFTQSLDPADAPLDISGDTLSYKFFFKGHGEVPVDYFIKLDQTTPPSGKIGSLKIFSENNDIFYQVSANNPAMIQDGVHPLEIQAASTVGPTVIGKLDVNVQITPFFFGLAVPPKPDYYYQVTDSQIDIPLDFSDSVPSWQTLSFEISAGGNALPHKGISSSLTGNQLTISIQTDDLANKGTYPVSITPKLDAEVQTAITFNVFIFDMTVSLAAMTDLTYTVRNSKLTDELSAVSIQSDPVIPDNELAKANCVYTLKDQSEYIKLKSTGNKPTDPQYVEIYSFSNQFFDLGPAFILSYKASCRFGTGNEKSAQISYGVNVKKYEGPGQDLVLAIVPNLHDPDFKNPPPETIEVYQRRYKTFTFPEIVDKDGYAKTTTDIKVVKTPAFARLEGKTLKIQDPPELGEFLFTYQIVDNLSGLQGMQRHKSFILKIIVIPQPVIEEPEEPEEIIILPAGSYDQNVTLFSVDDADRVVLYTKNIKTQSQFEEFLKFAKFDNNGDPIDIERISILDFQRGKVVIHIRNLNEGILRMVATFRREVELDFYESKERIQQLEIAEKYDTIFRENNEEEIKDVMSFFSQVTFGTALIQATTGKGHQSKLWITLGSIQLMWCQGFFDFDLPEPLRSTHTGLGSASKLDLFGFQSFMVKHIYSGETTDVKRNLQTVTLEPESYDFILMTGPIIFFFFLYPVVILVVLLFLSMAPKIKMCRSTKLKMECKNFAFFNYPFRLLLIGSTPILTAVMVHSARGITASTFATILIYVFIIILSISTPLSFAFLFKNKDRLGDYAFRMRYGVLYQDIYFKSRMAYLYTPLYLLRRFFIALPIVALPLNQVQQAQLQVFINVAWILIIFLHREDFKKGRFILELISEEILLLFSISLLLMAISDRDPEYYQGLAIFAVSVITLQLILDVFATIYVLFKTILTCIKNRYAKVFPKKKKKKTPTKTESQSKLYQIDEVAEEEIDREEQEEQIQHKLDTERGLLQRTGFQKTIEISPTKQFQDEEQAYQSNSRMMEERKEDEFEGRLPQKEVQSPCKEIEASFENYFQEELPKGEISIDKKLKDEISREEKPKKRKKTKKDQAKLNLIEMEVAKEEKPSLDASIPKLEQEELKMEEQLDKETSKPTLLQKEPAMQQQPKMETQKPILMQKEAIKEEQPNKETQNPLVTQKETPMEDLPNKNISQAMNMQRKTSMIEQHNKQIMPPKTMQRLASMIGLPTTDLAQPTMMFKENALGENQNSEAVNPKLMNKEIAKQKTTKKKQFYRKETKPLYDPTKVYGAQPPQLPGKGMRKLPTRTPNRIATNDWYTANNGIEENEVDNEASIDLENK